MLIFKKGEWFHFIINGFRFRLLSERLEYRRMRIWKKPSLLHFKSNIEVKWLFRLSTLWEVFFRPCNPILKQVKKVFFDGVQKKKGGGPYTDPKTVSPFFYWALGTAAEVLIEKLTDRIRLQKLSGFWIQNFFYNSRRLSSCRFHQSAVLKA